MSDGGFMCFGLKINIYYFIYRFHLQAFRHFYVMASESRLLLTKDVDSNSFCYVPIEIILKPTEHHDAFKYSQMAPCILPELEKIKEVPLKYDFENYIYIYIFFQSLKF